MPSTQWGANRGCSSRWATTHGCLLATSYVKVIKLLAPNIDTHHTVGQGVDSCVSMRHWERTPRSCNFSAPVMAQRQPTMATITEASGNQRAWLVPARREKNELRTDGDPIAWRIWSTAQNLHCQSFLVNKECLPTCVPQFERKNKSYRCSSSVVSKMYPRGGERSGSKSTMVLL